MILPLAVVRPVHPRRAHRRADSPFSSPEAVSSEAVRGRDELGGDGGLCRRVAGEHHAEVGLGPDRREVVRVAHRAAHVVLTVDDDGRDVPDIPDDLEQMDGAEDVAYTDLTLPRNSR